MTTGYGLFQAANNTKIMTGTSAAECGVVSGVLNLLRNLGLLTGATAIGAVFAWGAAARDLVTASPVAIVTGMHSAFVVAAIMIAGALVTSLRTAPSDQIRGAISARGLNRLDA